MENEWFDIAWINFSEAILHGQMIGADGTEVAVRKTLSSEERGQVEDMNFRHQQEMKALLKSFVQENDDDQG